MRPIKIVFTGGPCAGKTTQIKKVREYLESLGYKVIIIPETATDLITTGYNFKFIDCKVEFQTLILKYQYFKEEICDDVLSKRNDRVIILCDRGILDNKTYFDNYRDFDYIIPNIPKSEIEVLDSYDLVIDLLSLATCKPEQYNLSSNSARDESVEEAKRLDSKTAASWVGHRNLVIASSDVSIDEEFEFIKGKILNKINEIPEPKKLVKEINNSYSDFYNYNDNNSRTIDVESTILDTNKNGLYMEIQKRKYKGKNSWVLVLQDSENIYLSENITFQDYLEFINKYKTIESSKYKLLSFVYEKHLFDIKFYNDKTLLEYNLKNTNEEIIFPEEIDFNKEKGLK